MGCALPLALGAQLAGPERPVVAFTGDGGLLMVARELSTAAELGSKVIVVVFVDASLALIDLKQRQRQMKNAGVRSEEHTSELQSLMRISYAVFCLKKKKNTKHQECDYIRLLNSNNRMHVRRRHTTYISSHN